MQIKRSKKSTPFKLPNKIVVIPQNGFAYLFEEVLNAGHDLGLVPLDEELVEVRRLAGAQLQEGAGLKGLAEEGVQEFFRVWKSK